MAKKKGLPFVVQPRLKPIVETIGTEFSGQIEIVRKGYLTVAEKAIVQSAMKEHNGITQSYIIAREIAQAEGIKPETVFEDLSTDPQPEYLNKYAEQLQQILALTREHEERVKLVAATALILCRVNAEWTANDTVELHPDLQEALYALYKDEERKSVKALEDAAVEADKAQEGAQGKD